MGKNYKNLTLVLVVLITMLCSSQLKAQIEDFQVGATTRKMLVYAPAGLEPNSALLLSLHGMNQDIAYQQNQTKWESVAKEHGFVVVYPGGINNSWSLSGTRDIDFILAIIDEMHQRYGIDRDRVYLSGFSMGGMFTYYAATQIADKIAAFAPVGGYLMGGPNANSSRPIPLIHTHGTTDDVVAYSGVQRSLDAWIARNNCPKTAVVTQPYPADKPNSNGTKYYWGPGADSVEVVLLSIRGTGHWHVNDPNGIHSSQEIWNFCKKFSLSYGVSKFKIAVVNEDNPTQILVNFTLPIKDTISFDGFSVKVDDQLVEIDNIILADSVNLAINLSESILNTNEIVLTYNEGNVLSTYGKKLVEFNDVVVENLLPGAPPRIVEIAANANGDTLIATFNKNMLLPEDLSTLVLKASYDSDFEIPIGECLFYNDNSKILAFPLGEKVFADYDLFLTYSGGNILSADSSVLKTFEDYPLVNKSKGFPVQIVSGALEANAFAIALEFSKPMAMKDAQLSQFTIEVNDKSVAVKDIVSLNNTIRFILPGNLYYGDEIKVSYTPGDIMALDRGDLEAITDFEVANPLVMPTWLPIPSKVEAENFALQYGLETETTSDTGGGLNIGRTDNGDWLVYAIDNNTDDTAFDITFRIAAQNTGSRIDLYLNDVRVDIIYFPSTGGWQTWQSVVKKINIPKGQHYLKIVVATSGFNINYIDIQKQVVGVRALHTSDVKITPNPVSNFITINSDDFQYDKIEIFDVMGRSIYANQLIFKNELQVPVSLPDGVYSVRVSKGNESLSRRIVVRNK
jgi:poly(3-hydroxybutyrate) depolymerase